MLQAPSIWRKSLRRLADRLEDRSSKPRRWTKNLGAEVQQDVLFAVFIIRLMNEDELLPDELVNRSVPLISYPSQSDEATSAETFHSTYALDRGRDWSEPFLQVVHQLVHNYYFVTVHKQADGRLDSIAFCSDRRRRYLQRLRIETIVALLREAAADDTLGSASFRLTCGND